jgi:PEP-CTERM motif
MPNPNLTRPLVGRLVGAVLALAAQGALAAVLPPAAFTYTVDTGSGLAGCSAAGTAFDGSCDYAGPNGAGGTVKASGGVPGTPGYLPALPGTSVSSQAQVGTGPNAATVTSKSSMTYFLQIAGPAGNVPVFVISTGLIDLKGTGLASADFLLTDITTGGNQIYSKSLSASEFSPEGSDSSSWSSTSSVCMTTGDIYQISIATIATSAAGGYSALAQIDPKLKVDPPAPAVCPLQVDPNLYTISVSPGASTGFAEVPEPGSFALAGLGFGLLAFGRRRR